MSENMGQRDISEKYSREKCSLCPIFSDIRIFIFGLAFALYLLIISADIKLSKAKVSKIIQSGKSFGSWLDNLGEKALTNIAIPLARGNLPGFVI